MRTRKKQSRTGALTDAIINYLTMIGWLVYRNNTGGVWDQKQQLYRKNTKQERGVPDVIGIDWLGRSVAVEIKTGKDRLSAEQTIYAAEHIGRCGFYCIAKSIDDVIQTLRYYGYAVNESGHVITVVRKLFDGTAFHYPGAELAGIPNANLLKQLKPIEKATLSIYASGKQQKLVIQQWLGKYTSRVI